MRKLYSIGAAIVLLATTVCSAWADVPLQRDVDARIAWCESHADALENTPWFGTQDTKHFVMVATLVEFEKFQRPISKLFLVQNCATPPGWVNKDGWLVRYKPKIMPRYEWALTMLERGIY